MNKNRELSKLEQDLFSKISHEIKNPLNSIASRLEMVK